jgi:hypothetical protein
MSLGLLTPAGKAHGAVLAPPAPAAPATPLLDEVPAVVPAVVALPPVAPLVELDPLLAAPPLGEPPLPEPAVVAPPAPLWLGMPAAPREQLVVAAMQVNIKAMDPSQLFSDMPQRIKFSAAA